MSDDILEVVKNLDEAFNRKDMEVVLSFYDDDATLVIEPGKYARGKAALREAFEMFFTFNGTAKQVKTEIIEAGNTVLFISKWHLVKKSDDHNETTQEFCATSVFQKGSDNQWRLIIDNAFGPAILLDETLAEIHAS